METLRAKQVSTLSGTLLIVLSAIPLIAYTFYFRAEKAKLQNGIDTSPQFVIHAPVK